MHHGDPLANLTIKYLKYYFLQTVRMSQWDLINAP